MTSDIRNICAAYASIYNNDLKTQLQEGRDGFSEMDLTSLTNVQIQDIIEEVVEEMFNAGNGFLDIEVQMEEMFDHARTAFDKSEKRLEKINRVENAFNTVMESISSKSSRTMIETFMKYRQTKKYQESQGHRLGVSLKETNAFYGRSVQGSKSSAKMKIAEMMESAGERIASGDSNVAQEFDEATAMAKRGYDETKLRKRAGGGEAADRATALEKKPTYGDAKKAKQRSEYARKQRGDFRNTASSSPGLHGYGHQSNDPKVKAKQAARGAQRGALTPNEKKQLNMEMEYDIFDVVLEFLCSEGYAETLEEAEWMMANLIDEEAIDIILEASCEDDEEEMKKGKKSKKEEEDEDEEELDEALTGERYKKVMKKPGGTAYSRKVSADPAKRATRGGKGGESDFGAGDRGAGNKASRRAGTYQEEEFAIDEGAAGDVAARAQKLANQRKGQTPERKKMYQGLADKSAARERGPFKGGTSRQGMTPSERTRSREAAAYRADVHGGSATYGKGSLPKGKKLERQRARGVSERFEAWLDEALTGERYKKAVKKSGGTAYSRMVSADPAKRATRGGRGGESDFGAGDRGRGNRAARRSGKSVDDNRYED